MSQQKSDALDPNDGDLHPRVANTLRRITDAATQQFNAQGFGNVSIEAILHESGVARSTFYRLFKDKEALLTHIINPVFEQAALALAEIDPEQPELIVNGIAESYLTIWHNNKQALILSGNIGNSLFSLVREAHDKFAHAIYTQMERLQEMRLLRNDDPHLSAVLLAQTAVRILGVCEKHPQFKNVFISTLRGMLLKW